MSTTTQVLEEEQQQAFNDIQMASDVLYQQRGQHGEQEEEKRHFHTEFMQTLGANNDLVA